MVSPDATCTPMQSTGIQAQHHPLARIVSPPHPSPPLQPPAHSRARASQQRRTGARFVRNPCRTPPSYTQRGHRGRAHPANYSSPPPPSPPLPPPLGLGPEAQEHGRAGFHECGLEGVEALQGSCLWGGQGAQNARHAGPLAMTRKGGGQVLNTYGTMGSAALLLRYGFADQVGPFPSIDPLTRWGRAHRRTL